MFSNFCSIRPAQCVAGLIAGLALAGCEVNINAQGTTVTSTSPLLGLADPVLVQTTTNSDQTPPQRVAQQTAITAQAAPAGGVQTAQTQTVAAAAPAPARTRTISRPRVNTSFGRALPLGVTRANIETFKTVVTQAGCVVSNSAEANAVQAETGLTNAKLEGAILYLWRVGELQRPAGGYRLISGQCANA